MNKLKSIYNKNPFLYVFLSIIFIKNIIDMFVQISKRVELVKGLKDPYSFLHDLSFVSYEEVQNNLFGFISLVLSVLLVGCIFQNSNRLSITKKIILLIGILLLYSIVIYLYTIFSGVSSLYLAHYDIYLKYNKDNHSFIYMYFWVLKELFSLSRYYHENLYAIGNYMSVITYAVFVTFLDQKNVNYLTKDFINKVSKLNNKLKSKEATISLDDNYTSEGSQVQEQKNEKTNNTVDQIEVFIAKKLNKEFFISVNDIISIQSDGNYVELITHDDTFLIRATLKNILPKLPDFYMKIHRSVLINMNQVHDIKIENDDRKVFAVMENNNELPISRSNQKEFKLKWQETNLKNQ